MTDYKAIHGKNILHVASDLDNAEAEGQIWFNTTTSDYKTIQKAAGAWASANDINTTRSGAFGAAGTQTAGLIIAGDTPGGDDEVESYDGTSWTEIADINTARKDSAGLGTQTAALGSGGYGPGTTFSALSEEWDGSSWSEVGDLNTGRHSFSGTGTTAAGLVAGGRVPGFVGVTETYNGTAWTETGDLNTTRAYHGVVGSTTAALGFAGYRPAVTANSEEFDGSTWAEGNNVNTARSGIGSAGTQGAALGFGGTPPISALTEQYDGSSWAEVGDLNTARNYCTNSIGSLSSALTAGGSLGPPGVTAATEEWNFTSTLAAGAWATGTAFNTARGDMSTMGDGTTSSIRMAGGAGHPDGPPGPGRIINESWNGSSWTEDADLNSKLAYGGGAGTVTAGVTFAGSGPGSTNYVNNTEEWDGSSWSETADLNTGRTEVSGCGSAQTAGFCIGGKISDTRQSITETYNGTAWTETGDLNTARNNLAAAGTTTAAIVAGGTFNPSPPTNTPTTRAETWDGSSWTEGSDLGTARYLLAASQQGTTSSTMVFGGSAPTTGKTESYDGSSWTEVADMSAARYGLGGCGGSNQVGIAMGGAPAANHGSKVEEFSLGQNIKTITD